MMVRVEGVPAVAMERAAPETDEREAHAGGSWVRAGGMRRRRRRRRGRGGRRRGGRGMGKSGEVEASKGSGRRVRGGAHVDYWI